MTLELLRQYRIGGYAIFDLTVSYLGIFLISPWLSKMFKSFGLMIPKRSWLFFTLPIAIVVHLIVGAFTPMTRKVLSIEGNYGLKLIILIMLVLGLKGIKRLKQR